MANHAERSDSFQSVVIPKNIFSIRAHDEVAKEVIPKYGLWAFTRRLRIKCWLGTVRARGGKGRMGSGSSISALISGKAVNARIQYLLVSTRPSATRNAKPEVGSARLGSARLGSAR